MLLMSLDAATVTELLKGVNPELVEELALEVAHLDAVGYRSGKQGTRIARQFCESLQDDERFNPDLSGSLLKQMPGNAAGSEEGKRLRTQIKDLQKKKSPFARMSVLDSRTIASVLKEEHPRFAAVVISELPAEKSSDVLDLLGVGIRLSTVERMQTCKNMTVEAKTHIAQTICERLAAVTEDKAGKTLQTGTTRLGEVSPSRSRKGTPGKTALILHKLCSGFRVVLFKIIGERSKRTCEELHTRCTQLMSGQTQVDNSNIAWMDIPQIDDDLLQKGLKGFDARKLAPALVRADYVTIQKITSNISESAAAALREETSRLSAVRNEEVQEARREFVRILHQMT